MSIPSVPVLRHCPRCYAPAQESILASRYTGDEARDPKVIHCTNVGVCGLSSVEFTDRAEGLARWNGRDSDFIDEGATIS